MNQVLRLYVLRTCNENLLEKNRKWLAFDSLQFQTFKDKFDIDHGRSKDIYTIILEHNKTINPMTN